MVIRSCYRPLVGPRSFILFIPDSEISTSEGLLAMEGVAETSFDQTNLVLSQFHTEQQADSLYNEGIVKYMSMQTPYTKHHPLSVARILFFHAHYRHPV